ncbi:MAG: YciI family protein [Gemmatimonadota bacterium]
MRFYCLGYYDEKKWEAMSEHERNAFVDACFAYDEVLRRNGHVAGGDGLQGARDTRTVRWENGKAVTSTGPYAKTKEQLGGILVLEARDLDHAIRLISNHPGIRNGPFEIRQVEDMSAVVEESARRRSEKRKAS